ncbi:MAG: hypothetical protein H6728_07940 [Myxococcales bacterium]|nr:hypothetical protein [Myxococcales bacterium]MCB9642988.1 hypothetical protein [Myxococcales bacterium]
MRYRWMVLGLCAWLWITPTAQAANVTRINQAWESILGTQLVFLYYGIGSVGDLYKNKIYNTSRVIRYLGMLEPTLRQEQLFLSQLKPLGNKKSREMYRRVRAVMDFLIQEASALRRYVNEGKSEDWNQFATYRRAAVEDLQYVLSHQANRSNHRFRGGVKAAYRHLGHYLGVDLVFGYFFVGLVADGYFRLLIPPAQTRQHLGLVVRLLQNNIQMLARAKHSVPRSDRPRTLSIAQGMGTLIDQAKSLDIFVRSRQRSALKRYWLLRKKTWTYVRVMSGD